MKRVVIIISFILLILSGCQSKQTTSASNNTLTVMLDWYPNAVHSFLYVAKQKGYFKEQGINVHIEMPADTNDPLKLVATNKIDVAFTYQPEVIIARNQKLPVQSFAAIVRHPLNHLMVPKNSTIHSPKDLEGKTVGYPSMPLDEAIVHTMMQSDGGNPNKVKMVDVGFDLIPALATRRTDALIGGYINHEQLLLDKEGHKVQSFDPTNYGVPDYYELVLAANENKLKTNQSTYKKFMKAIRKAQAYVEKHPTESLSILLKHEEKTSPLDKEVETKSLHILLPLMSNQSKPFGKQDASTWQRVTDWLYSNHIISNKGKPSASYINF